MKSKVIYDNYTIYENGKKMSVVDNGKGYLALGLQIEPRVYKSLHRLLAEAFIPNPNNYSDVNHIDGNIYYQISSGVRMVRISDILTN